MGTMKRGGKNPRDGLFSAVGFWTAGLLVVACTAHATIASAAGNAGRPVVAPRGGGESRIDESAPDDTGSGAGLNSGPRDLAGRLREYVEGSLARYDVLKNESSSFRRRGWFPSIFLRDPERDVLLEPGAAGTVTVTVHLAYARRDIEQRLVVAPVDNFELPGADRSFFAELLAALATAAPEIAGARLRFWFAVLRADGQMTWEYRGGISLTTAAVRRISAGRRTAEEIWPLLNENTIPASAWPP